MAGLILALSLIFDTHVLVESNLVKQIFSLQIRVVVLDVMAYWLGYGLV